MVIQNDTIQLLDHGYIKYIEHWGSDERIVEAARMSTGKGFLGWGPFHSEICSQGYDKRPRNAYDMPCSCTASGDEKLLRYLYEHKHHTPFEMSGLVLETQIPIFGIREWQRHRTQSYNEMSGRYTPLPDLNYIPSMERLLMNSSAGNKQAGTIKGAEELTHEGARTFREVLKDTYEKQEEIYQNALKAGVPKELARIHLPVGRYTRMRASANLRNWLGFLTLRMDEAAQYEIRVYANALGTFIQQLFPHTWDLFVEGRDG